MCGSSPKLPPPPPAPPETPDAPEVLDQKVAATPEETYQEQLLAVQLGLNQLKFLPGTKLSK